MSFDLNAAQAAIRQFGFDGWLLYDFRGSNIPAGRILGIDHQKRSRRCAYFIPASGEPHKLVHRIEDNVLDHLPGGKSIYLRWQELEQGFARMLTGVQRVAMEYSPRNGNPYVSRVDAGTVELVRACGAEPVSSGDLVQLFEAVWDEAQERMHFEAAVQTNAAFDVAWKFIAARVRQAGSVTETEVQTAILEHFSRHNLTTYSPPIVGRGPHSGLPHYETGAGAATAIREGDFVLIDLWAKCDRPRAVYSDLTRTGFVGTTVPEQFTRVFAVVAAARDAAIRKVQDAFAQGHPLQGWEVDVACRKVIEDAGYGPYFCHRTGHNIGQEVHGNGANIDDLETHEDRLILPRTCFSIEPGIYLPEFGVRSEVDVYIGADRTVHVTGGPLQTEIVPILKYAPAG